MATIGVYDYDYFNYNRVIPNLECAKLCSYFKNKNQVTMLAPQMEPSRYTDLYIRKEYDDGIYSQFSTEKNIHYGGKAFSNKYFPLKEEIEKTEPNFNIYSPYLDKYGNTKKDNEEIKRILRAKHLRLSLNEKDLDNNINLELPRDTSGIILHDYDLAAVKDSCLFLKDLSHSRLTLDLKEKICPIGNKFPIMLNNGKELINWLELPPMSNIFFLQYNGILSDEFIYELYKKNLLSARQILYKIDEDFTNENDLIKNGLPQIFRQILFLRSIDIKFLLIFDKDFLKTKELKTILILFNKFLITKNFKEFITFFELCRMEPKDFKKFQAKVPTISLEEKRAAFQFIREKNYDLFKSFYEINKVEYIGGNFYDKRAN